jgi:glucosamine kinase
VQRAVPAGPPVRVVAGLTGLASADGAALQALLAAPFGLGPAAVQPMTDIELACHAAFAPGQGAVVYAGTGSIAAFVAADGQLHRAGGRGAVIDDAGGGHWIACQALRQVWRAEDVAPGAGAHSALGRQLFAVVGGSDWAATRAWVYGASRGDMGTLALAVAAAAREGDAQALALLQQAGQELARLAHGLHQRFGPLPLALAGRVFDLHPAVEASLRAALPAGTITHRLATPAHHQAARLAAARGPA